MPYPQWAFSGWRMPEIRRLGGTEILMFFHDENPPHIHVRSTGFSAKLRISNGDLLAGSAPGRILRAGPPLDR